MKTLPRAILLAATAVALSVSLSVSLAATTQASPATSTSGKAARTVLDVSDLEQGAPPAIAWSERRSGHTVIHGTGGTRTPAPNRLDQFAPMGSGHVVQTIGRGATTRWIAADGTPGRGEWRTGYGLAVSPRGQVVAFAGRAGRVWTIDQEGDRVPGPSDPPIAWPEERQDPGQRQRP